MSATNKSISILFHNQKLHIVIIQLIKYYTRQHTNKTEIIIIVKDLKNLQKNS